AREAKLELLRCQSRKLGYEMDELSKFALFSERTTSSLGRGKGKGRNSTPLTTEKSAVFAPIPKARVHTAISTKPGLFSSTRAAYFRSCIRLSIFRVPPRHTSPAAPKNSCPAL